ncbi:hypothetical protein AAFF_G00295350 [Aldrovandia affinis]|uniref:Uncharacterized protein n=1 Tax=Aldrovandia affinis TaxID=143900 RepID=A0AAD7R8Y9_9TELE|nr:hypothetical protein AAFF_G00295350 [Aldrovandia affinis]
MHTCTYLTFPVVIAVLCRRRRRGGFIYQSARKWKVTGQDPTAEKNIHWKVRNVPFNGSPFKLLGKKTYVCHQGRDKNKKAKRRREEKIEKATRHTRDHSYHEVRRLIQTSKKMDCPATIYVVHIVRFPSYKITEDNPKKRNKASSALKEALSKDPSRVDTEELFAAYFPFIEEHQNHPVGELDKHRERGRKAATARRMKALKRDHAYFVRIPGYSALVGRPVWEDCFHPEEQHQASSEPTSIDITDTADPDTADTDTSVTDTADPDTAVTDTADPDTAVTDTADPDTAVTDTADPDTAVTDTADPDTAVTVPDLPRRRKLRRRLLRRECISTMKNIMESVYWLDNKTTLLSCKEQLMSLQENIQEMVPVEDGLNLGLPAKRRRLNTTPLPRRAYGRLKNRHTNRFGAKAGMRRESAAFKMPSHCLPEEEQQGPSSPSQPPSPAAQHPSCPPALLPIAAYLHSSPPPQMPTLTATHLLEEM